MRDSRILAGANLAALLGMFGPSISIPRPSRQLKPLKPRTAKVANTGRPNKLYLIKGIRP